MKYILHLKKLASTHKKVFGEDKNLVTPTLISQEITKKLLKLKDYSGTDKKFDAEENGKFYEIKATSSEDGTTTINLQSKPHVLVWIYIDYIQNEITIKQKHKFEVIDSISSLFTSSAIGRMKSDPFLKSMEQSRVTIILDNISWENTLKYKLDDLSPLPIEET